MFGETFGSSPCRWVSAFAVDPGTTSGWVWLLYERSLLASDTEVGAIQIGRSLAEPWCLEGQVDCSNERQGAAKLALFVRSSLARARRLVANDDIRQVLIVEGFNLQERTNDSSLLSPVRLAARLDSLVDISEADCFMQMPSEAMGVVTDDRLLRWNLARPRHVQCQCHKHSNDAMRHLVLWLRKEISR